MGSSASSSASRNWFLILLLLTVTFCQVLLLWSPGGQIWFRDILDSSSRWGRCRSLNSTSAVRSAVVSYSPIATRPPLGLIDGHSDQLLMPLDRVKRAFENEAATLFVLRIMKTGSTGLDALFNTRNPGECSPHLNKDLINTSGPELGCNRLAILVLRAQLDLSCQDLRGWDDPAYVTLDCLPFTASYEYEQNFYRLPFPEQDRLRTLYRGARLVSGHFPHGVHRIGHRGLFTYVTQVRDPVARALSHVNHHILDHPGIFDGFSKEEFVLSTRFGYMKSNHQVRVLCNEASIGRYDMYAEQVYCNKHECREPGTPLEGLTEVTEMHYQCALSHLRHDFSLVFVSELVDEVLKLGPTISRLFKMKVLANPKIVPYNPTTFNNRTLRLSEAPANILNWLNQLNYWDQRLYEEAKKLHRISVQRLKALQENLS
ncbi:hypothetical protein KFL_009310050 [Klebsormidium nitens]|uniref:Sulfotransferase n=1 Tax=Klebsormidium nitens TaxID=105231 RepID=A0A1Y1IMN4_KLENI|nr:hypothetical protein KFL_009310050 [Klebsormidium nitens]|eukprot:GAQ92140.1 hypothetical protein KFL_009310050 [Klebsormidium nitens]